MPRPVPQPSDDVTVYLVLNDHGKHGLAYAETDTAEADRETVIRNFLSGQYSNALRVIAFNTAEGWSRDVSEDIAGDVLERAFNAADTAKTPSVSSTGTWCPARSDRLRHRFGGTPATARHCGRLASERGPRWRGLAGAAPDPRHGLSSAVPPVRRTVPTKSRRGSFASTTLDRRYASVLGLRCS
jgi:hypothetical protein